MSCVLNRQRASGSGAQGGGGFIVENSLRFNELDSAQLNYTNSSAPTDASKAIIGAWIKRGSITHGTNVTIIAGGSGESNVIHFSTGDLLIWRDDGLTGVITSQVFRDPAAWFHMLWSYDSDEGTAANRLKLIINGIEVTSFSTDSRTNITSGEALGITANDQEITWGDGPNANTDFDGYMAQAFIIDGLSIQNGDYAVSDFIDTDSNGNIIPVDLEGAGITWGNNGSLLDFAIAPGTGNGAGEDVSGNGNHFSESGLAADDQMSDSPTDDADNDIGNYCTWNPLNTGGAGMTLSNGNLTNTEASGGYESSTGTIGVSSGKYYYELNLGTNSGTWTFGWADETMHGAALVLSGNSARANTWVYVNDSRKAFQGTTDKGVIGTEGTSGQVMMCAIDVDAGYVWWGKQGSWFGDDPDADGSTGDSEALAQGTVYFPFLGNETSTTNIITLNAGQLGFTHTPPTGFKALNTANLPAPAVKDASSSFTTHGYTGTGSAHDETFGNNTSMDPDLVIIKNRDTTDAWNWVDSVRGATKELNSNSTAIESTDADGLDDLSVTDGFGLGTGAAGYNDNNEDFISYNWKANGAGSSNTDGSINTTKTSVNAAAGFSISTYTGTGANATIGHGLNNAPRWVVIKKFSGSVDSWHVYHAAQASDPQTDYLVLDTNAALVDSATVWNDTAPTSSVVSLGTDTGVNGDGVTYIAYCWEEIEGFSKFGVFTGNSAADGIFVFCGFRPALVIIKRTDAARVWRVHDNTKLIPGSDAFLELDGTTADQDSSGNASTVDFLANGFKLRGNSSHQNTGNLTFMAWAEFPFGGEGVSQARAG